jgi:hypothetical protein
MKTRFESEHDLALSPTKFGEESMEQPSDPSSAEELLSLALESRLTLEVKYEKERRQLPGRAYCSV